jgi:hypothetical protein
MDFLKKNHHYFYLVISLVGGALAYYYAMAGMIQKGGSFDPIEFIQSTWIDDLYARSVTFDFWTVVTAGTFFMIWEGLRLKMKKIWLFIVLTIFIAFAFGFPLFLFFRQKRINAEQKK